MYDGKACDGFTCMRLRDNDGSLQIGIRQDCDELFSAVAREHILWAGGA